MYWEEEVVDVVVDAATDAVKEAQAAADAAPPLLREAGQDVVLNFSALGRACADAVQGARDALHALDPMTAGCIRIGVAAAVALVCYYAFLVLRTRRRTEAAYTRNKRR